MMSNESLLKEYFPDLTEKQYDQIMGLEDLYRFWNQQINVVSRKDIDNLFLHHVMHSLVLRYYVDFPKGIRVIDAGTGGGFPGVPLAILFPETEFYLVDSTAKKLNVVDEVTASLRIENVTTFHVRLEDLRIENEAIVSRAVGSLPIFMAWVRHLIRGAGSRHKGVYYLKGGDVEQEARESGFSYSIHDLSKKLPFEYFATKKLIHLLP